MRHYKVNERAYSKVPLESLGPFICEVAADLTVVADVKSVQFIQPVWNWLEQMKDNTGHYNRVTLLQYLGHINFVYNFNTLKR